MSPQKGNVKPIMQGDKVNCLVTLQIHKRKYPIWQKAIFADFFNKSIQTLQFFGMKGPIYEKNLLR
jgi:hypothetical protein